MRSPFIATWRDGSVLVFDAETHAFLGASRHSAVLAPAVVDEVGQTG